jgi:hypothetical protein
MSIEYVINNIKTGKYIYATSAFSNIDPEDIVGSKELVENNLLEKLYCRNEEYHRKYCKYAASKIVDFVDGLGVEELDIHPDEYFGGENSEIQMYMTVDELDEWIKDNEK